VAARELSPLAVGSLRGKQTVSRAALKRALAAALVALACSGEPARVPPETHVTPQAAVLIEPPRLRVGDVAAIEVSVVTPPGYRVHPLKPPASVPGLWLLDAETLPVEADGVRQLQRTRIRVRARETGAFEWPALRVEIEDAGGARSDLVTAARPFEIVSVLPSFPERVEPFSYRRPPAGSDAASPFWAAAAGSLGTLALLAVVAIARRARRRSRARAGAAAARAASQPWVEAIDTLAAARGMADADWRHAAGLGACALRRYLARRFDVAVESLTTEEIAALPAPLRADSRWPAALACLRDFDAERFRAQSDASASAQLRAALDAAQRFVEASIPPEAR
jgi:hypothetical protein